VTAATTKKAHASMARVTHRYQLRQRAHPGRQRALQHPAGQLGLGRKPDLVGNASGPTARRIVKPALGQVQLPVDHPVPGTAGVGQVDSDLGVVVLAGGPGVLALHPHRPGALLQIPVSSTTSTASGSAKCSTR
jgi:hypothetical protein